MIIIRLSVIAVLVVGCTEPSPPEDQDAVITLTYDTNDGVDCFIATPDPASVMVNMGFHFVNNTMVSYTIMSGTATAIGSTPFTTVGPGKTSGGLMFPAPAVAYYYAQSCPPSANHTNRHSINVTVGVTSP